MEYPEVNLFLTCIHYLLINTCHLSTVKKSICLPSHTYIYIMWPLYMWLILIYFILFYSILLYSLCYLLFHSILFYYFAVEKQNNSQNWLHVPLMGHGSLNGSLNLNLMSHSNLQFDKHCYKNLNVPFGRKHPYLEKLWFFTSEMHVYQTESRAIVFPFPIKILS